MPHRLHYGVECLSPSNRQWIYSRPITGALEESNFSMRESAVPTIRQGQALVRTKLVSLDPANRTYFARQVYRPQLKLGDVMAGFALGEVIESSDPRFRAGDIVHGDLGWQDYAIINSFDRSEFIYKCTPGYSEEDLLGVLGITGLTAYFGLQELTRLSAGMTVVVGGATGACGLVIGQLAKIAGCRVVGFGGGAEKCRWLVEELGFDEAVNYKASNAIEDLAKKCPDGVDFLSDAVGGIITQSAVPLMKHSAPWYHYGDTNSYDGWIPGMNTPPDMARGPEIDIICQARNLRPKFLLVFDYYCQRLRAEAELAALVQEGRLKPVVTTLEGLEILPHALVKGTLGSQKLGKLNVRVSH